MTTLHIAILLRPLFSAIFLALVVWPLVWLLYRLIPDGRAKVVLFKVRTGEKATPHDKRVMAFAAIAAYVLLFGWIGILSEYAR